MDFIQILGTEFIRRKGANPRYSTRAFARDLEIEPSLLWKFMNGRRKLTPDMTARLAAKLRLSPLEVEGHVKDTRRDRVTHELPDAVIRELRWQHYLVLETLRIPPVARKSIDDLAASTGLERTEVETVLKDIVGRGLARAKEDGGWEVIEGNVVIDSKRQPKAKDDYAWAFERALSALADPPEERTVGAIMLSADAERVRAAKEMIRKFAAELVEFLNSSPNPPDGIYEFCLHLFPLSKRSKGS